MPGLRRKGLVFFILVLIVVFPAFISSGGNREAEVQLTPVRRLSAAYFGTITQVLVFDDFTRRGAYQNWLNCWNEIRSLLADLETKLSTMSPEGDIGRFNALRAGESTVISDVTAGVIRMAKEAYEFTNGAFNPTVYNLVDLWGFSPRFMLPGHLRRSMPYDRPGGPGTALPDQQYIEAFTRLANFSNVFLSVDHLGRNILTKMGEDEVVRGRTYSLQLDLGAIGKGYAADRVAEVLRRHGFRYGFVNLGSSSFHLLGYHTSTSWPSNEFAATFGLWPINIRSPFDPNRFFFTVYGRNESVSTSGSYERYYFIDGRRFSHIIDPRTGFPAYDHILSATFVGGSGAWSDAITTALCVMSIDEAQRFIDSYLQNYKVILILNDGRVISNTSRFTLHPQ